MEKISYESVDDKSLSYAMSRKIYEKNNSGHKGLKLSLIILLSLVRS